MTISFMCRRSLLPQLLRDRGGNFGLMTAILLPVLLGGAGIAVDVSNMLVSKNQLQEATDAASLAAASALSDGKTTVLAAQTLAKNYVTGQMSNYVSDPTASAAIASNTKTTITPVLDASGLPVSYNVTVASNYSQQVNGLTHLFGWKTVNIASSSSTTSNLASTTQNALSMYLVLDRSGSMSWATTTVKGRYFCQNYFNNDDWNQQLKLKLSYPCYTRKIEALEAASDTLFDQLSKADPTGYYTRTGAVAYSDVTYPATGMDWGTTTARSYIDLFPSFVTGGTDATAGLQTAYDALKSTNTSNTSEAQVHASHNQPTFGRFILLMTDGEMTGASSSFNKSIDDAVRAKCASAKADGITIYTVGFQAPDDGKSLLTYCASNSSDFYDAQNMDDLVAAFKSIGQAAVAASTRLTQ